LDGNATPIPDEAKRYHSRIPPICLSHHANRIGTEDEGGAQFAQFQPCELWWAHEGLGQKCLPMPISINRQHNPGPCKSHRRESLGPCLIKAFHHNMSSSHGNRMSQNDWLPDWLTSDSAHRATTSTHTNAPTEHLQSQGPTTTFDSYRISGVSNGRSTSGSRIETVYEAEAGEKIPPVQAGDELLIERNRDRAVEYASNASMSRV
jgi:hypothetical protein